MGFYNRYSLFCGRARWESDDFCDNFEERDGCENDNENNCGQQLNRWCGCERDYYYPNCNRRMGGQGCYNGGNCLPWQGNYCQRKRCLPIKKRYYCPICKFFDMFCGK